MSNPVHIIGAGLAGLTAALHLAERGITPIVLEADSLWAGGRLSGGELRVGRHAHARHHGRSLGLGQQVAAAEPQARCSNDGDQKAYTSHWHT